MTPSAPAGAEAIKVATRASAAGVSSTAAGALVTSANARKVVKGPCVTLLGYEETPTPMLLSTGTPKHDGDPLRTCFLRTMGNRVSDVVGRAAEGVGVGGTAARSARAIQ